MDKSELHRLSSVGLAQFPPNRLPELCSWCRDWCLAAPDVRYCALADALQVIADWFEERERYGNVLTTSMDALEAALRHALPSILQEEDVAIAVVLTRALHEEIVRVVAPGDEGLDDLYR